MKVQVPNDTQWQQNRQQRWDELWWDSLTVHGCEQTKAQKETIAAQKQWYLHGDLEPLMSLSSHLDRQDALRLFNVLMLAPIIDVEAYVEFFRAFSYWLSESNLAYWGAEKARRDELFIERGCFFYRRSHVDSSPEINAHMLKMFLPDETGVTTFPFAIGNDNWQPQGQVTLCDLGSAVLESARRCLFDDDGHGYSHTAVALPWVKWIKDLDPQYFALELITAKHKRPPRPPTPMHVGRAGQVLTRAAIGNLLGYKSKYDEYEGPLRHNNPKIEQQVRDLIADLDMPPEYHQLVKFIHAHPEDYCTRSA